MSGSCTVNVGPQEEQHPINSTAARNLKSQEWRGLRLKRLGQKGGRTYIYTIECDTFFASNLESIRIGHLDSHVLFYTTLGARDWFH